MTLEDALNCWYSHIGDYSHRNFTYEKDKLPAISGLAHELEKTIRSPYRAGLWDIDLVYGLLWRTPRATRTAVMYTRRPWRAPSWSWASLDEAIFWDALPSPSIARQEHIPRVVNLIATTHLLQEDPMGQVSRGTLTLEGSLKAAQWLTKSCITPKLQIYNIGLINYDEVLLEAAALDTKVASNQSKLDPANESSEPASRSSVGMFAICKFDCDTDRPVRIWCLLLTSKPSLAGQPEPNDLEDAPNLKVPDGWKSEQEQWEQTMREPAELEREQAGLERELARATDTQNIFSGNLVRSSGRGIMLATTNNGVNEYRRVGYFELAGEQDDWPTSLTKLTIV